jgi:hypothetical protein
MGLRDLNDDLYRPNDAAVRERRPDAFDPSAVPDNGAARSLFGETQAWNIRKEGFFRRNRRAVTVGGVVLGTVLFVAVAIVATVKVRESAFSDEKVVVRVEGPSEVAGSQSSRFYVSYANNNRADLENAELLVYYPDTFRPDAGPHVTVGPAFSRIPIGTVAGRSQGKIEFPGKFYGAKGSLAYLKAVLRYRPEDIGSEFQAEKQLGITIQSSSLTLDVEAPLEVASGGKVEYRVDYANATDATMTNIRLKAEYPEGFRFESADPKVSEGDGVWYIGNLAPGQKGTVRISGTVDGARNEAKTALFRLGTFQGDGGFLAYSEQQRTTKVIASPLRIFQAVNGRNQFNASPGETLYYSVRYRNDGEIGLRDVIVKVEIRSAALDFSRLRSINGGAYDSARREVMWKASDIPQLAYLAPGQEGEVQFSVPVVPNLPSGSDSDKNFTVVSTARIDSPDIPTPIGANKTVGSNTLTVKVNSMPGLQAKGFYADARIPNEGPLPPKVGVQTGYTLHWILSNTTNDLDQVQVTASLPTGVKWLGRTDPSSESISFNPRTNQIVWNVGSVSGGTGVRQPAREVAFQVGVVPEASHAGKEMTLLNESSVSAHDLFTGETLRAGIDPKTTILPEDPSIPGTGYQVSN